MGQETQGIWIARDKNGEIHGFIVKPTRGKDKWDQHFIQSMTEMEYICMVGMISVIVVGYMMLSAMR